MNVTYEASDLLVFSHCRWDSVTRRPQHLMARYGLHRRVFYFEEPIIGVTNQPQLHMRDVVENIHVVVPYLPQGLDDFEAQRSLVKLVDELISDEHIHDFTLWYFTPTALPYTRHLKSKMIIYDCLERVKATALETELIEAADLVFAGGQSLYEAKRQKHPEVHPFPSSLDFTHFARARTWMDEPADQAFIPHPRLGYFGTIDERMDFKLLSELARLKPDWHFVMIGPISAQIDDLPRHANIHYLGKRDYHELPMYVAGWDVALIPFARNEATRFISPTKTPEYLAAGCPVISTSIRDVVKPYGQEKLVYVADRSKEFLIFAEHALQERKKDVRWLERVDRFLSGMSWDRTWQRMAELESSIQRQHTPAHEPAVGFAQAERNMLS